MKRVLELKGYKSLRALNAFHALMLGLKMLPAYMDRGYEEFFKSLDDLDEAGQRKMIEEAALFVELQKEEIEALLSFYTDVNGIPYQPQNLNNLKPNEIHEIIVEVCLEVSKIKIDFLTDAEKKKLSPGQ